MKDISWDMRNPFQMLAIATLLGTLPVAAPAQSQSARGFDPVTFFTGRTTGEGRLKKMFSSPQVTYVIGRGRIEGEVLVLDQNVTIAGEKPRDRQWRLRAVAPGRWAGTLSDATGPVNATAAGAVLTIAYTSNEGMGIVQSVTLSPDGRSARNLMKVRKLGMTVATLDETITRE